MFNCFYIRAFSNERLVLAAACCCCSANMNTSVFLSSFNSNRSPSMFNKDCPVVQYVRFSPAFMIDMINISQEAERFLKPDSRE